MSNCGVHGLCIEQSVLEPIGFAFDPALIGETCSLGFIGYPLASGGYDRTTGWCCPDGL